MIEKGIYRNNFGFVLMLIGQLKKYLGTFRMWIINVTKCKNLWHLIFQKLITCDCKLNVDRFESLI